MTYIFISCLCLIWRYNFLKFKFKFKPVNYLKKHLLIINFIPAKNTPSRVYYLKFIKLFVQIKYLYILKQNYNY